MIEFCAALPAAVKTDGRTRKSSCARPFAACCRILFWTVQSKGSSIPLRAWLRGPLAARARELLVEDPRGVGEFFDVVVIRRMFEAHVSGRRNHAHRLWALMLFAQWYRLMIEQQAYKMAPPPFPDYEPMPVHSHVSADHRRR